MVNLLRFYETEVSIYLLLQHASGGKLWNYISGYLHQHSDTQLDDVLDDVHERKLRTQKPSDESNVDSRTTASDGNIKTVAANNASTEEMVDVKGARSAVTFHQHVIDTPDQGSAAEEDAYCRQGSTTEVDSLLDDNNSIDQPKRPKGFTEESANTTKHEDNHDNQTFSDVLKATDISVKAFSINSFESDGGAGSRMNSTTSDHYIESISEAQSETSPSHKPTDVDVFNATDSVENITGAEDSHAQKDVCDAKEGEDLKTYSIIKGAEAAIESANRLLNESGDEFTTNNPAEDEMKVSEVPTDDLTFSNDEVSIYDMHKHTEWESESSSPERPVHLFLGNDSPSNMITPKTSTPSGKSCHSSSTMSSPRDPERTPVIYKLPSQERSLESDVRPRKRNLSSVFRDLDLAEGEVKTAVHLPEVCVCQWAAEMVVAIGYLHCKGIICK